MQTEALFPPDTLRLGGLRLERLDRVVGPCGDVVYSVAEPSERVGIAML